MASSLLVKLQDETKVRNLMEVAIRADDRVRMEEVCVCPELFSFSGRIRFSWWKGSVERLFPNLCTSL